MDPEITDVMRRITREHTHIIWQLAKSDELEDLPDEEKLLGKIMLEHEEYYNQFECADVLSDCEFDPDTEVNPFLHITIHTVVENQLKAKDPIEAYQFYNSMRRRKVSRHDTIHLIGAILVPLIFDTWKYRKEFDLERYKSMLKKYKDKKPEKIYSDLGFDLE